MVPFGASAQQSAVPAASASLARDLPPLSEVALLAVPGVGAVEAQANVESRGEPLRFASRYAVSAIPSASGSWVRASGDAASVWRLRVSAPGAVSLNLGFDRYRMPAGGRLFLYTPDRRTVIGPFTEADNESHGQLWTPILEGDELVIEVQVPARLEQELQLSLGSVNRGFKDIPVKPMGDQGECNVDVVCSEADDWRSQIRSVAMIVVGGEEECSGVLVNNTASDLKPYFLTANHCVSTSAEAASVVAYWNYESANCGDRSGGSKTDFQTGAYLRATHVDSDSTLLELDDPAISTHGLYWAGWDTSTADPSSGVGIHHPSAGEKSISFENDPLRTTNDGQNEPVEGGDYLRVGDWDQGTTEGGSSGSPLFEPNGLVVGLLSGGWAVCGNDQSDWYGRISSAWTGGGTKSSRLSDWLNPAAGETSSLTGRDNSLVAAVGTIADRNLDAGGSAVEFSVAAAFNDPDGDALSYQASSASSVVSVALTGSQLTLTPGAVGSATVTVSANDAASADKPASQAFTVTVATPPANRSPVTVGTLADRSLRVGEAAVVVDVSGAFSDPDGDALTYAATSASPSVASVTVSNANVTVSAVAAGKAEITVTATDAGGTNTAATQRFDATVVAARGVSVSVETLSVTEGSSETYTVVLDAAPTGSVTVEPTVPSGTDVSAAPSSLTFTTTNWDDTQTVTVSAKEDEDAEDDDTVTIGHDVSGADYGSVTAPSVVVTIVENDEPNRSPVAVGTLADRSLRVGEDAAVVDVSGAFSDPDGDALTYAATSASPSVASVTVSNANVTVSAVAAGKAEITVTATDAGGTNTAATQRFDATVVAARGVSVSVETLSVTEGSSETYTVVLDAAPTGSVTVEPTVPSGTDVSAAPSSLTFTTTNWDQTQTVTVSAAEDDDAEDAAAVTIQHRVSGADYDSVTAPSVEVTIVENDDESTEGEPGGDSPGGGNPGGGSPGGGSPGGGSPGGGSPGGGSPGGDNQDGDQPPTGGGGSGGPPQAAIALDVECSDDLCRARTGVPVRFEDASSGTVRYRNWEFGDGGRSRSREVGHAWSTPGFFVVSLTVGDGERESVASRVFLVEASEPAGTCEADAATLCLQDSRFAVRVSWFTAEGETGAGRVLRLGTNDSGVLWFFDPDNWEVLIKVLDGCALNDRFWVFSASSTDLGYLTEVTDTATGLVREYRNEPGRPAAAITDTAAFPGACASVE